jgi:hypothetical protein
LKNRSTVRDHGAAAAGSKTVAVQRRFDLPTAAIFRAVFRFVRAGG